MKVDTSNQDPRYWERILSAEGLSMDRGSFGDPLQRNAIVAYLEAQQEQILDEAEAERRRLTAQ